MNTIMGAYVCVSGWHRRWLRCAVWSYFWWHCVQQIFY